MDRLYRACFGSSAQPGELTERRVRRKAGLDRTNKLGKLTWKTVRRLGSSIEKWIEPPPAQRPMIDVIALHELIREAVAPAGAAVEFSVGALAFLQRGVEDPDIKLGFPRR
jgi:hypothetical protein